MKTIGQGPDTESARRGRRRDASRSRVYERPRLVEYGNLSRLTQGAPTSGTDFMFGGSEGGT